MLIALFAELFVYYCFSEPHSVCSGLVSNIRAVLNCIKHERFEMLDSADYRTELAARLKTVGGEPDWRAGGLPGLADWRAGGLAGCQDCPQLWLPRPLARPTQHNTNLLHIFISNNSLQIISHA